MAVVGGVGLLRNGHLGEGPLVTFQLLRLLLGLFFPVALALLHVADLVQNARLDARPKELGDPGIVGVEILLVVPVFFLVLHEEVFVEGGGVAPEFFESLHLTPQGDFLFCLLSHVVDLVDVL